MDRDSIPQMLDSLAQVPPKVTVVGGATIGGIYGATIGPVEIMNIIILSLIGVVASALGNWVLKAVVKGVKTRRERRKNE